MPVNLHALLEDVIKKGASDLHISVENLPAMRVAGKLQYHREMGVLTEEDVAMALQSVVTPAQFEKYKTTNELEFSFSYKGTVSGEVRFRGNMYFALGKMSAAFRLIPPTILSIDDLKLPPVLKEISARRRGLFLVTGPTGHGKSTSMAAIINEINNTRDDHVITIEDPVEFVHKPIRCLINQREIGVDTESFAEGLRRALRQDPDVLLIGELRDLETIGTAITAAETGHLVFGTLHTQDAAQSIDRLIDVFPHTQQEQVRVQLATVLIGICSQQLIPKGVGYGEGRICATELLVANQAVKNCIREGKTNQIKTLIQTGMNAGMHTMEQSLTSLVKNNLLSLDSALAYAYDPKELQRMMQQDTQFHHTLHSHHAHQTHQTHHTHHTHHTRHT